MVISHLNCFSSVCKAYFLYMMSIFLLHLVFSCLNMLCLCVVFFVLILYDSLNLWNLHLHLLPNLETLYFQIFFSTLLLLEFQVVKCYLFFYHYHYYFFIASQVTGSVIYLQPFFCFSDWIALFSCLLILFCYLNSDVMFTRCLIWDVTFVTSKIFVEYFFIVSIFCFFIAFSYCFYVLIILYIDSC